jgi:streptogramin lyase
MTKNRGKVFIGLVALAALLISALMAFTTINGGATFAKGPKHHKPTPTPVHHKPTPTPTKPPTHGGTTDFAVPQGSDPWGTAFDSHGNVWVALPGCDPSPTCGSGTAPGKIGEFNPTNDTWTRIYSLPSGFGQPLFLAFDKNGNLWFPMPMSNSLGELSLSSGTASQWKVPTASAGPWGIAIDGNGTIWITEHYANKIASFNPSTHQFKEIATPAGNSNPYGITVDHSNNVWFTENNSSVALIAEYTTGSQLKEYKIRNSLPSGPYGLTPHLITVDGNGNIWWSEGWVSSIGKLVVAQAKPGTTSGVTEFMYHGSGTSGSHTSGIAVDHNGVVWFTDSLQSIFGSFNGSFTLYATPTPNSHPHDGMNVDASNVVWFDEEFANKLARHS